VALHCAHTRRVLGYRYTAWVPGPDYEANWNSTGVMKELYSHTNDTGIDFDAMDEPVNLAYNNAHEKAREAMHALAFSFFHNYLPPLGPSPPGPSPPPAPPVPPGPAAAECKKAGGILDHGGPGGGRACCPTKCGACGGKGCAKAPGGKDDCCAGEVINSGRTCTTDPAPCAVV